MKRHSTEGFVYIIIGTALLFIGLAPFAFSLIMAICGYLVLNIGLKLWYMPPLHVIIQYGIEDILRKFSHKR